MGYETMRSFSPLKTFSNASMELRNIILFTTAGFTLSYARYGKLRNGYDVMQLHACIWKGLYRLTNEIFDTYCIAHPDSSDRLWRSHKTLCCCGYCKLEWLWRLCCTYSNRKLPRNVAYSCKVPQCTFTATPTYSSYSSTALWDHEVRIE